MSSPAAREVAAGGAIDTPAATSETALEESSGVLAEGDEATGAGSTAAGVREEETGTALDVELGTDLVVGGETTLAADTGEPVELGGAREGACAMGEARTVPTGAGDLASAAPLRGDVTTDGVTPAGAEADTEGEVSDG
jgi:hypothetical protein